MAQMQREIREIQAIADNLTLKADYTEELEALDQLENTVNVFKHLGAPVWQWVDATKEIKRLRNWMKEEMAARKAV